MTKAQHEHGWDACPGSGRFVLNQEKRIKVRCPSCNRRLILQEIENGEEYGAFWNIPRHKIPKIKRKNK